MVELVACLRHGNVEVLERGQPSRRLESPYQRQLASTRTGRADGRIVSVTRGRTSAELCYAISGQSATSVFAQVPGSGHEQRLFQGAAVQLSELDFSAADEALACSVQGTDGTRAIGVFSDDGRGLRTVTEGDVIDRAPRWAPGGRAEIFYASAGIGRTKSGKVAGRSPFALHRLRFSDSSVEVLMADAHYDYLAVVPLSETVLVALRRSYVRTRPTPVFALFPRAFRELFWNDAHAQSRPLVAHELVRITPRGAQVLARDAVAFDVAGNEDIVYSNGAGLFRIAQGQHTAEPISALERVEQLVIHG